MSFVKSICFFAFLATPQVHAVELIRGIDQTISRSQDESLMPIRYLRLRARLSVYALYCNPALAVKFKQMGDRNEALERRVELAINSLPLQPGESEPENNFERAYNLFEEFRNEESSRYSFIDRARECELNRSYYDYYVGLDSRKLESLLVQTPYGLM